MSFEIPLHRGRRATTLPNPPRESPSALFSDVMKQAFIEPIRDHLHAHKLFVAELLTPDPWDEAVRSIEAIHEARQEWPWPDVVS